MNSLKSKLVTVGRVIEKGFRLALWGAVATIAICALGVTFGLTGRERLEVGQQLAEASIANPEFAEFGKLTPELMRYIEAKAREHDVNPALALAVVRQESVGDPWAGSPAGALGLMQVMPQTAKAVCKLKRPQELWDVRLNAECGVKVLRYCLDTYKGDVLKALACYNGSPDCQEKCHQDGKITICRHNCRETFEYVRSVAKHFNDLERRK